MRSLLLFLGLLAGQARANVAAPANLTATATGVTGQVKLNWSAVTSPAGITAYQLYRATYPAALSGTPTITYVTVTAFTDSGNDGQNYWYAVQADTVTADASLTVTAAPFAPPDPPVLTGSARSFGQGLALSWSAAVQHGYPIGAYRLDAMNGAAIAASVTVPGGVLTASVNRPCGAAQTLQVTALDVRGHASPPSAQVQLAYPCAPALVAESLNSGVLVVDFTAVASALSPNDHVELRSATYTAASWSDQTSVVTLTGTMQLGSLTTSPLADYAPLYFRLYSSSASGITSAASNEIVPLAAPTGLSGVAHAGRVDLAWTHAANPAALNPLGFKVSFANAAQPSPGTTWTTTVYVTQTANSNSTALALTGLADAVPLSFTVATVGGQGVPHTGEMSGTISLTPRIPSPVISSFVQVEGGPLTIGWGAVDASPNTYVSYSVANGDATLSSVTFAAAVTSTSAVVLTPTVGGDYWFVAEISGANASSDLTPTGSLLFAPRLPAPANLTATATNGRVQLSWDPVANATEYQVYRATQGGIRTTKNTWIVNSTTLTDTFPANGQANDYVVLARMKLPLSGSKVESAASVTVTVSPEVGPGIPGAYFKLVQEATGENPVRVFEAYLTATANAAGDRVDLSWTASAAGSRLVSSYNIYSGLTADSLIQVASVPASLTTYAMSIPDPLSRVYGVEAVDTNNLVSPRITGTASAYSAWPAPVSPSAFVFGTKAVLSWAAPYTAGNHRFVAYVVSALDLTANAAVTLVTVTYTSYSDLSLPQTFGAQRIYSIQVLDSSGSLGPAATVGVTYNPAPSGALPTAVQGVQAKVLTGTAMPALLTWQAAPLADQVTGYLVYRSGSYLATVTSTAYEDNATAPAAAYDYVIQPANASGLGVSTPASPSTLDIYPPQVGGLKAVVSVDESGNTFPALRLTWNDLGLPTSGAADYYSLYRSASGFTGFAGATHLVDTTVAAYTDSGVTPGAFQNYFVVGKVGGLETFNPSASLSLSLTVTAAPAPPGTLTALSLSTGVKLSWPPRPEAREYWVFRSSFGPLGTYPSVTPLAKTSSTTYSDGPLDTSLLYNYAVVSANELASSASVQTSTYSAPGTVSNLSATAGYVSGRQIQLSWVAPASPALATAYYIRRAVLAADLSTSAATSAGSTTSTAFVDNTVAPGQPYFYEVDAFANAYSTGNPNTGPVTAYDPPNTVLGLSATGSRGRIDAVWNAPVAPDSVTGYAVAVLRDTNFGPTYTALVTGQSLAITGLAAAEGVTLSVTALNTAGASSATASVFAVANDLGPVAQPVTFNATVGFIEGTTFTVRVLLSWNQVAAGQNVLLYRSTGQPIPVSLAAGGSASPLYLTGLSSAYVSLTDAAVSVGFTYYYAMTLAGPTGSADSESLPLRANAVSPFSYPSRVSITGQAGYGRVDVSWSVPTFAGSTGSLDSPPYRLYRYLNAASTPDAGFPLYLTANAYADFNVAPGGIYQYAVAVIDSKGREQLGKDLNRTAGLTVRPASAAPDSVLAIPGDRAVTLRWLVDSVETLHQQRFNVYRRDSSSDYGAAVPGLYQVGPSSIQEFAGAARAVVTLRDEASPVSVTSAPPVNKTTYCYAITMVNDYGEGGKSPEVCATPYKPLKPLNPRLDLTVTGKKDVLLTWDNGVSNDTESFGPNAGFRLYRSLDGGTTYTPLHSGLLPTTLTAYTDKTTDFGASYVYRLVPVDTQNQDGLSYNLANVIIPSAKNAILLFRNSFNPGGGEVVPVQFSLLQPGHAWVRVYTLQGDFVASLFEEDVDKATADEPYLSQKKVWDGKNAEGQTVASGVYLVHLEAPGYRANARVAVIK